MSYDLVRFADSIPLRARAYAPTILLVVGEDVIVSPFLVFGIGDRETLWGHEPAYKKGAGDWTPRVWSPDRVRAFPHVKVIGRRGDDLIVMPDDGFGWGRGLMQIDFVAEHDWVVASDWRDPRVNIEKGVEHLNTKFVFLNSTLPVTGITDGKTVTVSPAFATHYSTKEHKLEPGSFPDPRPLVGGVLELAAVASYNARKENVLRAIVSGGIKAVDVVTTEKNYSADVRGRAISASMKYGTT